MKRFWYVCAAAVVAAGCAPYATANGPVAPTARVHSVAAVDSVQLLEDIGVLAHDSMEGRATGTPGGQRARSFMERSFRERGVQPFGASYVQPFTFTRRDAQIEGANVVGFVRGSELPDRYIVVTAHYDHLGIRNGEIYNGADDNASGSAGLLALASRFVQDPPRHSIIFAAFDAEEMGLQGARAFVAAPPVPKEAILLNVNMDMIGRNNADELYVAGTHHYPDLLPLVQRIADAAEVTLIPGHDRPGGDAGDDWTLLSDHGAFHAAGIPFLYFGVEDHADYHRSTDTIEGIQPGFYVRAVRTVLAAIRLLDAEL